MRLTVTVVAVLLAPLASRGHAQHAPASPPTFEAAITLIQVDVSVIDSENQSVRGLEASDFTVLEDGAVQNIQSFTAIDVPPPPPLASSWMQEVPADVRDNVSPADHRIMAIVLDDQLIRAHMTGRVKQLVRLLVEGLGPEDQAAIVFTRNNRAAQDFTTDRASLLAAVEKFSGAFSPPVRGNDSVVGRRPAGAPSSPVILDRSELLTYRSSLDVLTKVCRSLAEIPRRRKAIVYVNVGIPLLAGGGDANSLLGDTHDLYRDAQRASVNIYPVDPSKLGELDNERAMTASMGDGTRLVAARSHDFLRALASNTGGIAIVEPNDLGPGVRQVLQDTGTYYVLGYQPPDGKSEGRARKVTVKVTRPGVTVRTRAGYFSPRKEKPVSTSDIDRALGGLLPASDVEMRVAAAPFAAIGRPGATVALVVALTQPPGIEGSRLREQLDLAVSAYDTEGGLKGRWRDGISLTLRPGPVEVAYEVLSQLDLKPGKYQLRVAARSAARERAGSVHYDLEVPDFTKRAVVLSGLVLSADPAPPMATPDRLGRLLPVVPTTLRRFTTSGRTEAFARVYRNDKASSPIALTSSVTRAEGGEAAFEATETLAADRFEGRAADFRLELPVPRLAPGRYILAVEAKGPSGAAARRVVAFQVDP
jgi:VWFA-related protein